MEFYDSWGVMARLSVSIFILVIIVSLTLTTNESRLQKVNKISLLVYYAVIMQSIFMVLYYTSNILLNLTDKSVAVIIGSRFISGSPIYVCTDSILLIIAAYLNLIYELLRY